MSLPPPAVPPSSGGVPLDRRSLAPDLSRGVMLLVIATVHAHIFQEMAGGLAQAPGGALDTATTAFMTMFAEARGYPMFAALFGYGLARIHLRRVAAGHTPTRVSALVRGRGRWMVLIGLLHTVLLFFGDVIAAYGLIALLFAGLLHVSDRRLLAHGLTWMALGTLAYAVLNTVPSFTDPGSGGEVLTASPLADMVTRLLTWPVMTPMLLMTSVFPFTVGVWAARRRIMEEPEHHLGLLRRTAYLGIPAAALGGLPHALASARLWEPVGAAETGVAWLHLLTGYAGGFGYAALIALAAVRLDRRRGPIVQALAATGQRSMTCYLLQSVGWTVLFMPYTLDLASRLSGTGSVLVGAAVWLTTVVIADVMRRTGTRGPAERLLRWGTYRGDRSGAAVQGRTRSGV
ncbi:DUF418 domain-containing protein [Nocardiopsis sp. CT-R113]|uniref:DUF418 domain-containing protein n=1 Tax=Nocardiopsis codii TaxID=3065942 RepID=A0ABU7K9N7_9ACTN|nr:DUF418 domain-containing protein [Nocardiopsis sp. CT-R113]MEE2038262.1 DUF418 domain-containing protein [Nocardiopsis sp. CT-R113]